MNDYCLPVTRKGNRFVANRRTSVSDLLRFRVLEPYLQKHFSAQPQSNVDIGGVTYRATVYEPRDVVDNAFALVDDSGIPSEKHRVDQAIYKLIQEYWYNRRDRLQASDSMSVAHGTFLKDEFIIPCFRSLDHSSYETSRLSWQDIQRYARLVIVGAPGSGKTTCLRMLAVAGTDPIVIPDKVRVPVYIALRTLREDQSILNFAAGELGRKADDADFLDLAESGRLMFLCDGLDEVNDQIVEGVTKEIFEISQRFPSLGMAISTREAHLKWSFPGFSIARLEPFSELDREEWIRRRVARSNAPVAENLITFLTSITTMKDYPSTPLMLTLVANAFEGSGLTPTCTSDLVLRLIDALVDKWDSARGVARWKTRPYDEKRTMRILCRTAFNSMISHSSQFTSKKMEDWENEWADKADATTFLRYVWEISDLLAPSADLSTWRFQNRTIRDVLSAKYLVERTDDILKFIPPSENDDELPSLWKSVCEISQDASPVISTLLKCSIRPEVRACILMTVLIGNASLKRSVLDDAHKTLILDLSEIAKTVKPDQDPLSFPVAFRLLSSKPRPFLDRFGEIISSALTGGILVSRRDLANALAKEENWLVKTVHNWLVSPELSTAVSVAVSDIGVSVVPLKKAKT